MVLGKTLNSAMDGFRVRKNVSKSMEEMLYPTWIPDGGFESRYKFCYQANAFVVLQFSGLLITIQVLLLDHIICIDDPTASDICPTVNYIVISLALFQSLLGSI